MITAYDAKGRPIKIEDELNNTTWSFRYVTKKRDVIESVECTMETLATCKGTLVMDGYDGLELYQNPKDRELTFRSVSKDGLETTLYSLVYKDSKFILEEKSYTKCDSNGNPVFIRKKNLNNKEYTLTYTNTYDDNGNLIEVIEKNSNTTDVVKYSYTYSYVYCPADM